MIAKWVRLNPKWLRGVLQLAGVLWLCMAAQMLSAGDNPNAGHVNSPIQLDDIVVTAEKIQEYIENHPQQVTAMTRKQIELGSFSNLDQVLNTMPGVEVKKSGSGLGSRISIRGSGNSGNILVLINGRPANSSQYGGVDLESIPLNLVERVDVFKPPVPVWPGPGGAAGAINIMLANPTAMEKKEKKNSRIGVSGGSFGKAGVNASHLMIANAHQVSFSAAANHEDGRRRNSDRDNGSLSVHWDLPKTGTTRYDVNGRYYQSEHGSAGPTYNPTPDARQSYQKGALDLRAKGVLSQAGDFEIKPYLDITRLEDTSQAGMISVLDALTYGLKSETSWNDPENRWTLRMTGSAAEDCIEHTLSGNHQREQASLGIQGDRKFDFLTATVGGRGDYTSDFSLQPAATAGIGIPLPKEVLLKLNAGYTVNIPTFGQLYQPSHGAIDQVRGNPDLKEERIWSLSTGISHRFAKDRTVELTFFREESDDLIAYEEGADFIKRPVNIEAGAYRQGLEAVADWKLSADGKINAGYIWQKTCNRGNDQALSYTPDHKFRVALHWAFATRTRTETTLTAVSDQFSDLENLENKKIGAYQTVDFKIVQPFQVHQCPMEFSVFLQNLLNEEFESHHGYPDDGFRVTFGVKLDF
ncbi:MAG: TonB-dependent receptor [Pseudomonadota bacterium]